MVNFADETAMGSFFANKNSPVAGLDARGDKILNIVNQLYMLQKNVIKDQFCVFILALNIQQHNLFS